MNRSDFLRALCCLLFMLGSAHPTCADTYYVATNGQDAHPGTEYRMTVFDEAQ